MKFPTEPSAAEKLTGHHYNWVLAFTNMDAFSAADQITSDFLILHGTCVPTPVSAPHLYLHQTKVKAAITIVDHIMTDNTKVVQPLIF